MTPRTWARLSWSSRAMRSRSAWIVHCSSASWRRAVRTAIGRHVREGAEQVALLGR